MSIHLPPVSFPITTIGGIEIASASMRSLTDQMSADCFSAREQEGTTARTVFDANGQGLSMHASNPEFRSVLDKGDIIHADGGFLVFLSRLKKGPAIPERTATTDFIWAAAERAEKQGLSFFLLGGEKGLTERTKQCLLKRFPKLIIAGYHHGYFSESEEAGVVDMINASKADIVWVGLGKPREQQFCIKHKNSIEAGWLVTCGGCFHFVTGDYSRAPNWMQTSGLEWVHRLVTRPRALFMRYLITTPHSLYLALTR